MTNTKRSHSTSPDPTQIVHAEFRASAPRPEGLPPPTQVEVAFAGRSNVGKSSLMNALVERKDLVRTSSKPGSTRQLNVFEARARDGCLFSLVDLPGYGYTKRSKSEQTEWKKGVESYFESRVTLRAVVIVVDIRRGVELEERELIEYLQALSRADRPPPSVVLVATKTDILASSARLVTQQKIARASGHRVIGFSAVTGEGRRELWRVLRKAMGI